jgi:hypothetical protein
MLRRSPGGMNGATNGTPHAAGFSGAVTGAGYLRIVIRRLTVTTLPALSLALTRTVTLPECP